jgi:hypothetical protein
VVWEGRRNMDYVVKEKTVWSILEKLKWTGLFANKKKNDDLQSYIGYVKIPGLNNGQRVFLNKGFVITNVDI